MHGSQLREIRTSILSLTQAGLAKSLDMTPNSIARMERGEMKIEFRTVLALRWLVYEHSNITFEIKEPPVVDAAPSSEAVMPPTTGGKAERPLGVAETLANYLQDFCFTNEMLLEAQDKFEHLCDEFKVSKQDALSRISEFEHSGLTFLNLRTLRHNFAQIFG